MQAHTPGPWELWTGCSWRRFGSKATGQTVCEPTNSPTDGHPDLLFRNGGQDGPDARLIAAAPDLLEACRLMVAHLASNASGKYALASFLGASNAMADAITKATTEE